MKGIGERILELMFPRRAKCLGCGDEQGCDEPFLCEECRRLLKPSYVFVRHADWRLKGLDSAMFVYYYGRPVRGMIRSFKFRSVKILAEEFSDELESLISMRSERMADMIVPVPLHSSRQFERGFNQSELLGRVLSRQTGVPMRTDVLQRIRRTRQQSKLKPAERGSGLTDAFHAAEGLRGKCVFLVDDVITTGGTACACAAALKRAGASEVHAVAIAGSHRVHRSGKQYYRKKV